MLQSLIRNALRASSPALAASLRYVLEGLHSQRLTPGTDAMLLWLYHPLLFRDLAAANAAVRNNALQLLVEAFPLQDSAAPAEVSSYELSVCAYFCVLCLTRLLRSAHLPYHSVSSLCVVRPKTVEVSLYDSSLTIVFFSCF